MGGSGVVVAMQTSESTKNNSLEPQSLTITNLNDKISYINKKRMKIQELDNKYSNNAIESAGNRQIVNKSEMLTNGIGQSISNVGSINEDTRLKGKNRVKRAQEANKLLKAYNMDPDVSPIQA